MIDTRERLGHLLLEKVAGGMDESTFKAVFTKMAAGDPVSLTIGQWLKNGAFLHRPLNAVAESLVDYGARKALKDKAAARMAGRATFGAGRIGGPASWLGKKLFQYTNAGTRANLGSLGPTAAVLNDATSTMNDLRTSMFRNSEYGGKKALNSILGEKEIKDIADYVASKEQQNMKYKLIRDAIIASGLTGGGLFAYHKLLRPQLQQPQQPQQQPMAMPMPMPMAMPMMMPYPATVKAGS